MHASLSFLIFIFSLSLSVPVSLFQCPDRLLRGLEARIVNCQVSCLALIPLSEILSNIKSCEIGGRFLIILITAFLSLLKRAQRNRFRSGNYPCSLFQAPGQHWSASDRWQALGKPPPRWGHRTGDASWEEIKLSHPRLGIGFKIHTKIN